MAENLPITVSGGPEGAVNSCSNSSEIIDLEFDILGETVQLRIDIMDAQVRLADIVPLARTLSTKLTLAVINRLRKSGKFVPCCKGCPACCNSYLVPLSVPEAFRLRQEVLAMPEDQRQTVLQSCLDTAKSILDKRPKNFDITELAKTNGRIPISQISKWYAGLKLACPLLSDGLCTLYEQRPIACREHIVTGSALLCKPDGVDEPHVVPMPVSVVECLGQLTAELEQSDIEAVMFPLVFPWVQENLERSERTWPAVTMVKRFVEILQAKVSENTTTAAAPHQHSGLSPIAS